MTGKLIQQQIYTRGRGGIFLSSDGYDTIAISEGLDKSFVKKYLHPFCIYQSPKALTARGEKDTSLYPEAVTLFQPETGDLVIGQSVFVPVDFTGQRSAYFVHNYMIPSNRKDEWIKQPEKLFQINDFKTSYKLEQGDVLPVREEVGFDEMDILYEKDVFLAQLGISEEQFKQLLFAVMSSIAGKKKVFISLNVPLQDYSKAALKLLELLCLYFPYAHRRKLGAMTFSSNPEGKNYIHVMFYEPGTLNTADHSIEKQFIFDFANGRISGVAIAGQKHEYLDFALEQFSQSKRIDDFFEFAETALSGLPEEQHLELSSYYQLTDLYLTLCGSDTSIYYRNKISFINGLVKFLQVNSAEKKPLAELFVKLLQLEKYAQDPATAIDYITAVLSINKIVRIDEALSFILETLAFYENDPLFHRLWNTLEQEKPTYEAIVSFINKNSEYEGLLKLYLEERFKQLNRIEDILGEIKTLLSSPLLVNVEIFHTLIKNKIATSIGSHSDFFQAVLAVFDFNMDIAEPQFTKLKNEMQRSARTALLYSMHPKKLTIADIKIFGRIFPTGLKVNDERAMRNYIITITLYQLLSNPTVDGSVILKPLIKADRELLREILQQLLQNKVTPEYLQLLAIAYASDYGEVDYSAIFNHLSQYSDDKTVMVYIRESTQLTGIDKFYRQALRDYLVSSPSSIWKHKTYRNELKLIRNSSFKNLLKTVETETASPVIKFLRKNGIKLLLALLVIGVAGGGTWAGVDYLFGKDNEAKVVKTSEKAASKVTTEEIKEKSATVPLSLEDFKQVADKYEDGQTFMLDLEGTQLESVVGQAQGVLLTDNKNGHFPLDLRTDTGVNPFDKTWKLKEEFSLSGIEYDFDPTDKSTEVVLVAKNDSGESYLWVYSINVEGLKETGESLQPIQPVYQTQAEEITDVKLDGKQLTLTTGETEDMNEYPFLVQ